jgi:hypothetical protein
MTRKTTRIKYYDEKKLLQEEIQRRRKLRIIEVQQEKDILPTTKNKIYTLLLK